MRFATAFKPLFIAGLMLLAVALQPSARAAPASNPRWKFDLVDSAGDVGKYTSLARQPGTGMPAVGYYDGTNTHPSVALHVGAGGNCGPGNSWDCEALGLSGGANQGEYVSLAFQTDGRTGLFYYDVTNSINRYDGPFTPHGFFQFGAPVDIQNLVQDTTGKYNSARFDLYGIPHVAYFNQSPTNALRYATYVTNTTNSGCSASATWEWQCDTIESFLGFGLYPSLDLNFIGQPRIAYVGLTSLKLATYLGSGGNCGQGSQLNK